MAHVVTVSDQVWSFAQQRFDMRNPAPRLREVLTDWMVHEVEHQGIAAQSPETAMDGTDYGTIITFSRSAICSECHRVIPAGAEGIIARDEGMRVYRHLEHQT